MSSNRYTRILEKIFFNRYKKGAEEVTFFRQDIENVAAKLGITLPKNLGDLIYTFRFRAPLPEKIVALAPAGKAWVIRLAGSARYSFALVSEWSMTPNPALLRIKVPDSTPGIIARYALDDEQALLARVRYNRLIDIFTGVACYSLQNHLRTSVKSIGQIEIDELYVGLDRRGAHYVFPVQAKGGRDRLSIVQIEQDLAMCAAKFSLLLCRPIGALFLPDGGIALMEFVATPEGLRIAAERHYQLVPTENLTPEDLALYKTSSEQN
jgi:hypothetical protein